MAPILRSVVAQVSRGGRSFLSRRNFSSEPCSKCGRTGTAGETGSSTSFGRRIGERMAGTAIMSALVFGGLEVIQRVLWK